MGTLSTSSVAEIQRASAHVAPPRDPSTTLRAKRSSRISQLAPVLGAGAAGYLLLRRNRSLGLAVLGTSVGLGLLRWQLARWVTEQAQYTVEISSRDFEVRHYAPTVRAETTLRATTWHSALNEGFTRLAGYLLGDNVTRLELDMTAPVLATVGSSDQSDRVISFIMPARYALAELPAPKDARVQLRVAPGRRVAALKFRGRSGGEAPARKRAELLDRVRRAELTAVGEVLFAGYDAPSTLPWLRRNEVLVEVL